MTRTSLISLFFIGLLVFILYQIALIFSPFLQAIFWAAILTFAFYPIYKRLCAKWFKFNETLNALLMTTIIFFIVVPPFVLLIINVTGQAIDLYQSASAYIRDGHLQNLIEQIRMSKVIQSLRTNLFQWGPLTDSATEWILNSSKATANFAIAQAGTITKNVLFVSLNMILMFFLIFVFLKDGAKIYDFIYQIAPLEDGSRKAIFKQIHETFSAVIHGQILTSLTQALVAGIVYTFLGLPASIFLAVATFFATLIPVIGAVGVWLPLSIYLFTIQEYTKGGILLAMGIFVISVIDNIMKPALIGEKTRLPYFMLFFGILGGLKLYGLMGVFLAPTVLSLFFAMVKIYQEKYMRVAS